MSVADHELAAEQLRKRCDPEQFSFETTADVSPLEEIIGQERAIRAIRFGLDIQSPGYNVFVAGLSGTGKGSIVRRFLTKLSANKPVPDDVVYVHNFEDPDSPRMLFLPAGKGHHLRDATAELIEDLHEQVPKAFEGKDYDEQRRHTAESHQEHKQELLDQLEGLARERGFELKSTPMGFRTVPIHNGKPLTQEEYEALKEEPRSELDEQMERLEKEVRDVMAEVKAVDQEMKEQLRDLNQQVAMNVLGTLMADLKRAYAEYPSVNEHLQAVEKDIVDNIEHFREIKEQPLPIPGLRLPRHEPDFSRYEVNVVVDNSHTEGSPVVFESNPTFTNLVGRIERRAQFGALLTDFTMIRAGSLAKANGGYLVLNVEDMLRNPHVYEALKRAIRDREIRIEDLSERYGLFATQTLNPEPIPLETKVILLGNPMWYQLLFAYDEDFAKIFKVKADFDHQTDREEDRIMQMAAFVARFVEEEGLRHMDRAAFAAIIEQASRMVEDQEKLSLRFSELTDLMRESAYWAEQDDAEFVSAQHVERAVEEQEFRAGLVKDRVQELIYRDVLLVDTNGEVVGQVNGLAVHMLGHYAFGRPSRITANVYLGNAGVVNIERRSGLSHSTHDKGVLILSGFLGERFAQDRPISMSAALTFEQSYGEIAGDSASSTELYCLLSALSGVPIKQGIAVTGSVNQKGEVQAIGGVNHKIEGFFDVCKQRGLSGEQGVLIPVSNLQHLMVRLDIVEAVANGDFHVWAVSHVDEGIEVLTGIAAGAPKEDGGWEGGSINKLVDQRLEALGNQMRNWGKASDRAPAEIVNPVAPEDQRPPEPPKPPDRPDQ
ncbi:MAG: AAA family ATPase [Acidobacteria bacterium]|nr:AAA family ATPase [Acidobacteriota bacterium]